MLFYLQLIELELNGTNLLL